MGVDANVLVRLAEESDLLEWQHFVDRTPGASCMHHAAWYMVLRDAYSVKPYFLIAKDVRGDVKGILPLYHSRSLLTGYHLSSLEDGVLAIHAQALEALLAEARSLRDFIGARYLQVRGGAVDAVGAKTFPTVRTFIDTCRPVDALWSAIKRKNREAARLVRLAEKTDINIEHNADLGGLDEFYRVYAEHMRDLGTPVMGVDHFRALRSHLGSRRLRLYLVKERERVIGGMLCIVNEDRWTGYHGAVRPSTVTDSANYLLYWHIIRDAATCGAPLLDLGRSLPDSNVHHFKRKWGGRDLEVTYHFYPATNLKSGDVGLEELKRSKGLPQRLWSHLPLNVCNHLGPLLRRQLPFI
jgi:FemAB-related protein (PEP-CTERM system-associated)